MNLNTVRVFVRHMAQARRFYGAQLGLELKRWPERFHLWWRAPVTRKDRWAGALIGAFAAFWVGVLLLAGFGAFSKSSGGSAWWAVFLVLPGALFGYRFPKVATVLLFPFASIGGGV